MKKAPRQANSDRFGGEVNSTHTWNELVIGLIIYMSSPFWAAFLKERDHAVSVFVALTTCLAFSKMNE